VIAGFLDFEEILDPIGHIQEWGAPTELDRFGAADFYRWVTPTEPELGNAAKYLSLYSLLNNGWLPRGLMKIIFGRCYNRNNEKMGGMEIMG
jgi:hypothetical protein